MADKELRLMYVAAAAMLVMCVVQTTEIYYLRTKLDRIAYLEYLIGRVQVDVLNNNAATTIIMNRTMGLELEPEEQ